MQNSQVVKKGCSPHKTQGEIRCEIKGGSQEMTKVNSKKFKNNNSGKFGAES